MLSPTLMQRNAVVVIPAYNEERFIGSVVLKTRQIVSTVIVVDDGSRDATAEIAEAAGAVVVRHEVNKGKGVALNTGFLKAKEYTPEVVITLDGDWQHMPEEMALVAAPILEGGADIVVGSRYLEKSSDVPVQRVIGHWGFTSLTNIVSGVSLTDSQSGYRAFSPAALEALTFSSNSFSVESEMQFLAKDHKLKVVEVPITIRYVDKPKRNVLSHGLVVLNGILRLVAQHRPLLFFAVPGVFTLLAGLLLGVWVVYNYWLHENLAVGTALIVVILMLTGVFLLFTGIVLHSLRVVVAEIKELYKP
ncbi:MAG: glycosyltransferase family 2 protein [Phototrophicales bacterium]|nr:MAG: glycosyltransferase family 2 protein [Phototrophicales bacterium]